MDAPLVIIIALKPLQKSIIFNNIFLKGFEIDMIEASKNIARKNISTVCLEIEFRPSFKKVGRNRSQLLSGAKRRKVG